MLAAGGCLFGVVLAYFGAEALVRIMSSGRFPGMSRIDVHVQPDLRVLLFTSGVALLTGVLFGIVPAWIASSTAPASSLRATGSAGDTPSRRLIGGSLVVAQVALSIVLLSAGAVFAGHVWNLRNLDLGFRRDSLLLVRLDPQGSGCETSKLAAPYRQLLTRLAVIPGVRSATLSAVTPVEGAGASRYVIVPGFQERPEDRRRVSFNGAAPGYFETLSTPLVAGRDFTFEDAGRSRVAIVNQSMARHYFGDSNPIGQLFTFERRGNRGVARDQPSQIVAVVGDTKYLNLQEPKPRMVYLNAFQDAGVPQQFSLRTNVRPEAVAGAVRRAVRDVVPTVTVARVTTMTEQVDASIIPERLMATLSGFFGGLGALLAAIGLYGLLAYTVARRTSEIGIRMALGATHGEMMRMVRKSAVTLGMRRARARCAGVVPDGPAGSDLRRQHRRRLCDADRHRRLRRDRRGARRRVRSRTPRIPRESHRGTATRVGPAKAGHYPSLRSLALSPELSALSLGPRPLVP